jgi:hypothetical protein
VPEVPDGITYRYLFWDAYTRGLLRSDPEREEALRWVKQVFSQTESFHELRREKWMDSALYFNDLWTRVTYEYVSTVWNRFLSHPVSRPRKVYIDREATPLPAQRYPPSQDEHHLSVMRGWIKNGRELIGEPEPGNPNAYSLERAARRAFAAFMRPHTLIVVVRESPHYTDQFSPHERDQYDRLFPATVAVLEKLGFAALAAGQGFTAGDYNDRCHLSESGGARLAEVVARRVRELAAQRGYVRRGEGTER